MLYPLSYGGSIESVAELAAMVRGVGPGVRSSQKKSISSSISAALVRHPVERAIGVRGERADAASFLGDSNMLRGLLLGGLLLSLTPAIRADDKSATPKMPPAPTNAGLEKLKKLAGTWVVADSDGKPTDSVKSIIRVTSGGSAVYETIFPGQPQEMISVYTAEGPYVLLTHFCVLGNQPRMKAEASSPSNQLVFRFAGGGNLDPKKDKHMHEATLTIVDDDHLEVNGCAWENGEPAKDQCCGFKLVRKK
jgi:hypothetical protein